jgi:hypothetical protein
VEVDLELLAELGDLRQRVDDAGSGVARSGHHEERPLPGRAIAQDPGAQGGDVAREPARRRDRPNGAVTKARHPRSLDQRVVRLGRGVERRLSA